MCKEGLQVPEWMKEGHILSVPFLSLKTCCTSSLDWWPHVCLCEGCKEPLGGAGRDAEAELPAFCSAHPRRHSGKAPPVGFLLLFPPPITECWRCRDT